MGMARASRVALNPAPPSNSLQWCLTLAFINPSRAHTPSNTGRPCSHSLLLHLAPVQEREHRQSTPTPVATFSLATCFPSSCATCPSAFANDAVSASPTFSTNPAGTSACSCTFNVPAFPSALEHQLHPTAFLTTSAKYVIRELRQEVPVKGELEVIVCAS